MAPPQRFEAERPEEPARRPAKVALELALARQTQRAIEAGEISDQAEAARLLGLTRARVSQLLDLTLLAPDIQEQVLFNDLEAGMVALSERSLRPLCRIKSWTEQRSPSCLRPLGGVGVYSANNGRAQKNRFEQMPVAPVTPIGRPCRPSRGSHSYRRYQPEGEAG